MKLNDIAKEIYEINVKKGYYKGVINIPEKLCLIHSEVTEALEADRADKHHNTHQVTKDRVQTFIRSSDDFREDYIDEGLKGSFEEEMADIIIRTLSLCQHLKIDIDFHVRAKIEYNRHTGRKKY